MTDMTARSVKFIYTNWKGETSERWATPLSFRWGTAEWHPKAGWLMRAFDHDKGAEREFALRDCIFSRPVPAVTVKPLDLEEAAQIIYERGMRYLRLDVPKWFPGGNSLAQNEARSIAAALSPQPSPQVTPEQAARVDYVCPDDDTALNYLEATYGNDMRCAVSCMIDAIRAIAGGDA
ncbi:hypothetical protein [Leisingera sp. M523]|uniref:hypothetical protein n=1 Tax=Leisingera sp. M523 TaxID=2867013 RepID=UPI0021A3BCD4|nr:hypothetical protein [Leisingera sp. M523]UWQ30207.1 hypothetical protein K3557_06635 [Leisingera sp. M523]